jgi:hypothetical protein
MIVNKIKGMAKYMGYILQVQPTLQGTMSIITHVFATSI